MNAGRICWAVAGALCEGQKQGAFHAKRESCVKCDFFRMVVHEEGASERPTKLLKFFADTNDASFLGELTYRYVKAGERFLVQGGVEDTAYIIQEGTCLTVVEKDGALHPAGHWSRGDIVGIRGLFTGEPRGAHVEAETDMHLWVLNKHQIDTISRHNPELLALLTEIVASQFDSKRPVADRKIGKYVTTHIIGRGAYSIVYKAIHNDLKMVVAIKMMRHNMVIDSDFLQSFRQEAQIVASLNHQNILKVYDFEERYKTVFIVTEYLEGESLRSLLKRLGKIPQLLAIKYIRQICDGFAYAHAKEIVHRDINADNIMVLPDDRIKILDFGLACRVGTEDEQIGGTLAYQAPELLEGAQADRRSDIYALGVTAFELITGKMPFTAQEIIAIFQNDGERVLPDPAKYLPDILPELLRVITKACRHDRQERYRDIPELINDLAPLLKENRAAPPLPEGQKKSTTITVKYTDDQQQNFDHLLVEFGRRLAKLDIEFTLYNPRDQTGSNKENPSHSYAKTKDELLGVQKMRS